MHGAVATQPAYGRHGVLRDEIPEDVTEWDIEGDDGDPIEDFRITLPHGGRQEQPSGNARRKAYTKESSGVRGKTAARYRV